MKERRQGRETLGPEGSLAPSDRRRAAGAQEGGWQAGSRRVPGRRGLAACASPPARGPPASQRAWPSCGKLSQQNLGGHLPGTPGRCRLLLQGAPSAQTKPVLAESWAQRSFDTHSCWAAFKDGSAVRAPIPCLARGAGREGPASRVKGSGRQSPALGARWARGTSGAWAHGPPPAFSCPH